MASDVFMDSMLNKDDRISRIEGVVRGCEDILSAPESTPMLKKYAIETAYKHIVKIIKGEETK